LADAENVMNPSGDFWYIRLPDGRILRAASTTVVRQELGSGRIPAGSTVRRSPEEEWVAIEWTREFADLVEQAREHAGPGESAGPGRRRDAQPAAQRTATIASRMDSDKLRLVGVRDVLQELTAALDSTLVAPKLFVAAVAGLVFGILATIVETGVVDFGQWLNLTPQGGRAWNLTVLLAVGILAIATAAGLLTQLTYVEVSRLRLAKWREGWAGLDSLAIRLAIALAAVGAGVWGLVVLLRWLPIWLLPPPDAPEGWLREVIPTAVLAAGMGCEVALWAILSTSGLLAPLLVVEGCSIFGAIAQWLKLLRDHLGRVFLFEALAVGIGFVLTLPFVALLAPLGWMYVPPRLTLAWTCALDLLAGLVGALFLAYVIVANVFIYLHLRYTLGKRR
jgi:hypothetical protein